MNNYVIGVGLKGQNVVMKEFNAIKKAGAKLSKGKINVNVGSGKGGFASVRNEINARKQLEREKRNADATRGVREMEKRNAMAVKNRIASVQSGAGKARDALGAAMTGGLAGVASSLPGIGALFSAAQSSIEAAAQEFVAGVTATKNIRLIENNFSRAFGDSMREAFDGSMFSVRQNQAVYANLAEQGVKTSTLSDRGNVDLLDKFARAQGVGSLEELFQRMQAGQLKEGGGLGKGEIEFLKSSSQMLNNRYSAEIGMQTILRMLKSKKSTIEEIAGTGNMRGLAQSVRSEGNIQTVEQNFSSAGASAAGYAAYQTGMANRIADRADRMRFQRSAQFINNGMRRVTRAATSMIDDALDPVAAQRAGRQPLRVHDLPGEFIERLITPATPAPASEGGGVASPDGSAAGGSAPLSQSNSDLTRAGAALANTLNQINTQLMAVQYQMRTRGA